MQQAPREAGHPVALSGKPARGLIVHIYIYIHIYIRRYIYIYIYIHRSVYIYIYIYVYIYKSLSLSISLSLSVYVYIYIYIHIHIHNIVDLYLSLCSPSAPETSDLSRRRSATEKVSHPWRFSAWMWPLSASLSPCLSSLLSLSWFLPLSCQILQAKCVRECESPPMSPSPSPSHWGRLAFYSSFPVLEGSWGARSQNKTALNHWWFSPIGLGCMVGLVCLEWMATHGRITCIMCMVSHAWYAWLACAWFTTCDLWRCYVQAFMPRWCCMHVQTCMAQGKRSCIPPPSPVMIRRAVLGCQVSLLLPVSWCYGSNNINYSETGIELLCLCHHAAQGTLHEVNRTISRYKAIRGDARRLNVRLNESLSLCL